MGLDARQHAEERFRIETAEHELTILHDAPPLRHLKFRRPGTGIYGFDIITWPGHLCYTGDMGTYVFSRLLDMFEFFRGERINPSYWQEKALAVDRTAGIKKFSPERFKERILEWAEEDLPVVDRMRIEEEVLPSADDGAEAAYRAAMDFQAESGQHPFQDFWEADCTEWDHRFLWGCHAIQWGVAQYDWRKTARKENP